MAEVKKVFEDVSTTDWAAADIADVARWGLMMGTAPGKFEPDRAITRREMAALAARLFRKTNEDFVEIIDLVLPSVVQVENKDTGGLGSGTIISPDGYVLTCYHVIQKGEDSWAETVGFRTTELPWHYAEGHVAAVDKALDLAVCKIDLSDTQPPLRLANPTTISRAQKCMAIGSPLGLISSVTEGVVSAVREGLYGRPGVYIQTEAEINPGNSGGALVNLYGELIGVPSLKLVDVAVEGLNFAISVSTVRDFLKRTLPHILEAQTVRG